jgi:predicted secreted protein
MLSETAGTGYSWRLVTKPDRAVAKLVSDRFVAPRQTNPPMAGVPGRRVWRWRAAGRGETTLKIQLFPPGVGTRPAETYRLMVVVH